MTATLRMKSRLHARELEIRRAREKGTERPFDWVELGGNVIEKEAGKKIPTARLGRNQIGTLRLFEAGMHKFRPNRAKEPWQIMKTLVARGLLWVEWRETRAWEPATKQWDFRRHEWWAGLTVAGYAELRRVEARKYLKDHPAR